MIDTLIGSVASKPSQMGLLGAKCAVDIKHGWLLEGPWFTEDMFDRKEIELVQYFKENLDQRTIGLPKADINFDNKWKSFLVRCKNSFHSCETVQSLMRPLSIFL